MKLSSLAARLSWAPVRLDRIARSHAGMRVERWRSPDGSGRWSYSVQVWRLRLRVGHRRAISVFGGGVYQTRTADRDDSAC
jgi:hypothetical protein